MERAEGRAEARQKKGRGQAEKVERAGQMGGQSCKIINLTFSTAQQLKTKIFSTCGEHKESEGWGLGYAWAEGGNLMKQRGGHSTCYQQQNDTHETGCYRLRVCRDIGDRV